MEEDEKLKAALGAVTRAAADAVDVAAAVTALLPVVAVAAVAVVAAVAELTVDAAPPNTLPDVPKIIF